MAIYRAVHAHQDQQYGDGPYIDHLSDVVWVLRRHKVVTPVLEAAAWLHDTVEDTDYTLEEIRDEFGDEVAALVHAVTSEPGENRKQRNTRTYLKIINTPGAVTLKLADRIANVQASWKTQDRRLFMYYREYPGFRTALRRVPKGVEQDPRVEDMWKTLDNLLGWWEKK
jgi:(p)ppGpp synthase/HD superfamily hydrolase